MHKTVTVRDVWEYFGYRQIVGNDESLNREIRDANTNRPGLELAGYLDEKASKRIVVIGEKEMNYIHTMSEEAQRKVFDYLTGDPVPMILISRDMECPPILREIAYQKNFPVFSSYAPTNSLVVEIVSFLEEFFAPIESIHGVLMQVFGRGVLIRGDSGLGKSEIALELIKRGHILVADDRVDIYRVHNSITGEAPEILRNLLEIRGVGIINVTSMFGIASTTEKSEIDYVIDLDRWSDETEYDRLNLDNEQQVESFFGVNIPRLVIPVSEGRSIAVIIETAVTNQILRSRGVNSSNELEERVIELINRQKGEN
ncbi:MAG: HPr(Ser) kinase/phosphatase [Erysipelotrichaceae bacterium]|nr:HPr(Ser) kinase/phosphatase [Erysipelotrichaceae bacterium]